MKKFIVLPFILFLSSCQYLLSPAAIEIEEKIVEDVVENVVEK